MLGYNELYELLRKEKYSENLQPLPKKFVTEFAEYFKEQTASLANDKNLFSDVTERSKKQLENSVAIFRELILRRKRKLLNLAFVATETGIMKRDFENMLQIENETFEKLVKAFEEQDKEISKNLHGETERKESNKMVLFKQDVEPFVDHIGTAIGPFKLGELANLDSEIATILVTENKAVYIDEN